MESKVAITAREAREARERSLTPEERVRLALTLGRRACALYAAGRGLTLEQARGELEEQKRAARRR